MDFVPLKSADGRSVVSGGAPRKTKMVQSTVVSVRTAAVKKDFKRAQKVAQPKVVMPESRLSSRTRVIRKNSSRQPTIQRTAGQLRKQNMGNGAVGNQGGFALREDARLGEIEDLSPKFVRVDVSKRPLGDVGRHSVQKPTIDDELKEVKSKKLIGRFRNKKSTKTVVKAPASDEIGAGQKKDVFIAPKPIFINQDKVAKRPLSKNIYQKKVDEASKKVNDAPVAIIEKPEKESKIGLIITIILTIILGAVAGTLAFLLLPK